MKMKIASCIGTFVLVCLLGLNSASAETQELRVAHGYGIAFLPLLTMQHNRLVEKEAKKLGIGDLKVKWVTLGTANAMNEALLSHSVDLVAASVVVFETLWAKTRGTADEVKSVGALCSMPLFLNTRNPKVHSVKDFTERDRIAMAGVKVSIHALVLQMAAEQAFGRGQEHKLDRLTVAFSHPDGMAALLSGGVIDSHFTSPPYQYQELKHSGVHTVVNSYDVLGGKASYILSWTTTQFRSQNPKVYKAFANALSEAMKQINANKTAAAKIYLEATKDKKDTLTDILAMLNDPQITYTATPHHTMKFIDFMQSIGTVKTKPASWKEMFFPEIQHLAGS